MTEFSSQQQAGIDKIRNWYQTETQQWPGAAGVFRLFGYAGTGKTTLAKEIPAALGLTGPHDVVYGTFTGKAANVLRNKGAGPVSTIHSAIYMPTTSQEAREALEAARWELAEVTEEWTEATSYPGGGSPDVWMPLTERKEALEAQIPELEAAARRLAWEWNEASEWANAKLIILDEVSMVGEKLALDIERFGRPVLVLGDPAQLPPVEGGGYYINAEPDHLLTEIHRSALDNPITARATRIRESTGPRLGLTPDEIVPWSVSEAMRHDQVLVWSNKRRWALIKAIRTRLGRPEGVPVAGDRIMCLTNNKDMAVFNGQQFEVLDVTMGTAGPTLAVKDENGAHRTINAFADGFGGQERQEAAKQSGAGQRGNRMLATFATAITVHKAQGSEWPSVYVVDETAGMISMTAKREGMAKAVTQARRWLYTAATRAQNTLTIAGRK